MSVELAALGATVLLAAVVQGAIGFAFGMILMSFLPRLLDVADAVAVTAVHGLLVALLVFLRYRRHVDWAEVRPQLAGAALGLPLGVLALQRLDPDVCLRILGVVIVLYVVLTWRDAPASTGPARVGRAWAPWVGCAGGALGGAFAAGGPPVIAYASARRLAPAVFKAVLQAFFLLTTAAHVGLLAGAGILTRDVFLRALPWMPLVPVGVWAGGRLGDRLRPALFRRCVLVVLGALGLAYVIGGR